MAMWDTAYIDNLPDSSFLYIEPGGKKDSDGKTEPRSLRHFPVKDAQGKPDPAHVRNALARIPQSNVPAAAKEEATRKAEAMLKDLDNDSDSPSNDPDMDGRNNEPPPRDSLVRTSLPFEVVRSKNGMPTLHGRGAVYNEWTEINSRVEGHFMERFAPGAFTKTINEQRSQIRCLFNHGQDPSIGMKPLGVITDLAERDDGVHYEVDLFDVDYTRSLVPGLRAGVYGSSFRFGITRKEDMRGKQVSNSKGILERTITEAYMRELGPTPFPAYGGTTAGIRSLTDEFVIGRFPAEDLAAAAARTADRDLLAEMRELARAFVASQESDEDAMRDLMAALAEVTGTHAPSDDAAPEGTSHRSAAKTTTNGLYGLDRDRKDAESWRL